MNTEREELLSEFLRDTGWQTAKKTSLAVDASTRSYQRLQKGNAQAILMNAPPGAESAACPVDATAEDRLKLGYNAMARLAGPNLSAFTEISNLLRSAGLHAPEIYFADAVNGFALIEDFGDNLYAKYLRDKVVEEGCYLAAVEALVHLHCAEIIPPVSTRYTMLQYDAVALKAETDLLTEWYWPMRKGVSAGKDIQLSYNSAWQMVLASLAAPSVLTLRDYHAENLLWLSECDGIDRVGIIDFQDGLIGQPAYDLASLLEDARRDVAPDLALAMKHAYKLDINRRKSTFDADQFELEYAILAAQRNAKILGIFARLVNRDKKEKYRELLPRVEKYFLNDIRHPALLPVRKWVDEHLKELSG